jgi:hypothetical protein
MAEGQYGTLGPVLQAIAAITGAGLLVLGLLNYTHGFPPILTFVGGVVLVVLVMVAILTVPQRVLGYTARRKAERSEPAPPNLTVDLLAYIDQAKPLWGPDGLPPDSFNRAAPGIINILQPNSVKMEPNVRIFVEQVSGILSGWRCRRPVLKTLLREMDGWSNSTLDRSTFLFLLDALATITSSGGDTANQFVACLNNTQIAFAKGAKYEWNNFAGKANALDNDIEALAAKVKVAFKVDPKHYLTRGDML